jgi:salicylate hydroxylase
MNDFSATNGSVFENHPTLPIVIVGDGLCGLALAIGLTIHGVNIRVFGAAAVFSEVGAGVAFGINSITALVLLDPRLVQGYKKHATCNANREQDEVFDTMRWGMDEKKEGRHVASDLAWHLRDICNYEHRCSDAKLHPSSETAGRTCCTAICRHHALQWESR